MPLICTRDQNKFYQAITTRVLSPARRTDTSTETLRTFSIKKSTASNRPNSKHLLGTIVPNSAANEKLIQGKLDVAVIPNEGIIHAPVGKLEISQVPPNISATLKVKESTNRRKDPVLEKPVVSQEKYDTNSIISGSSKLRELKELHEQLMKPISIPIKQPAFEPRRPTLEAIKDAIERAKQMEIGRHKNLGTDDDKSSVSVNDASTSTVIKGKKKKKKFVKHIPTTNSPLHTISTVTGSPVKKKKIRKKIKKIISK